MGHLDRMETRVTKVTWVLWEDKEIPAKMERWDSQVCFAILSRICFIIVNNNNNYK